MCLLLRIVCMCNVYMGCACVFGVHTHKYLWVCLFVCSIWVCAGDHFLGYVLVHVTSTDLIYMGSENPNYCLHV